MIHVWMLIVCVFVFEARASDFNYIKLNPQFEHYLNQPKLKSIGRSSKSQNAPSESRDEYDQKIRVSLLGASAGAGDFNDPFPVDGEESRLYEQIRAHLESAHREIGAREVTNLDFLNRQFNLGTENFSGFSWQKPYGVVHVWADRQVTPNLYGGSPWLIQDTFTFDIEATTFLERSNEAGITAMSDAEIGAFAGITFKRTYTYYHYANSYNEALRADFSKLFLPFLKFNTNSISRMGNEEIIKRDDNWTASIGGMIASPPYYGFSVAGGILAQYSYQNLVSVQNINVQDSTSEKIRVTTKSKQVVTAGVNVNIQAEFLRILKITIMSADLSYEFASSKEVKLGMSAPEWQHVIDDQTKGSELRSIIRGHGQVASLEPYVVELEENESTDLGVRGTLLIWGRLAKTKTEQVRVIKDNTVKTFFKSYAKNMRVVQNVFSRLFSAVIYKIFKFPMGTKNAALYNRQVDLEYEATHPQASDINIARIDNSEQFSFVINQSYEAARTDRWIDQKFKNDVIWFVDAFTTLPKDYKTIIRSEQLKGPIFVESNLRVEKAGFDHLLKSPLNDVFSSISKVCGTKNTDDWINESSRERRLSKVQVGADLCVKNIGKLFLHFKSDYQQNALKPSIVKFKSFLTKYYKRSESLNDLTALFGEENTFIHGQIKATTPQNSQFITSFSTGQFRGMGVIDNYKRSVGSRQPASIVSE